MKLQHLLMPFACGCWTFAAVQTDMRMKNNLFKILLLGLGLFPGLLTAQVNLTSGLIAHLPLNGNGFDISGNGNHASVSVYGVTPTANYLNMPGQAMLFDGANDNAMMNLATSLLNNRTAFSMSYWFNLAQLTNGMSLVGQDNILETGFYTGPNRITVYHPTASANVNLALGVGNWQHLVVTCDATEMKVYLNGVLASTIAGNFTLGNNTTTTNLGGNVVNQGNNTWLRGRLDEVRFYNRVLNAAEVTALFNTAPLTVSVTALNNTTYCAGDNLVVDFTASGEIYNGNEYILEMSDATGSFTNPIPVARMSSMTLTGIFTTTVPSGTPSGTGYRFRVNSNNLNAVGNASSAVTINGLLGNIPNPATFRYVGNVNGKDYYISLATQTLANARTTCTSNGGVLATVPDARVNMLFGGNLSATNAWIGFTDEVTEGTYLWSGGAPVTYLNWFNGEPNNTGNEDYAEMQSTTHRWVDRTGTQTNVYFMELAPAGSTITVCQGGTVNLTALTVSGAAYSWSGPNGFTSSAQNPTISNASVAASGTYTVTITASGCSATATTTVTVNPIPLNLGQTASLPASLTAGLILYYPMNGNATDASGGGNNGTIFGGVTAAPDRFGNSGQALQFNGTNGYIDVPDGVFFNGGDFSVSAWVRVSSYASWSRIMDFGNGSNNNNVIFALTNGTSGRPSGVIYNGPNASNVLTAPNALPTNTWNHVVYTFAGGGATLYINGQQVAQVVQPAPVNIARTINYIGRSNWAADAYANARMDEFRIYNRLLTVSEIQALVGEQPTALTQVASPVSICANTSGQIILYRSQPGISYQLRNSVTLANIGTAQTGTGDSLVFSTGSLAATTSFFFTATSLATGCSRDLSPVVTVTVIPAPAAPLAINDTVCNGGILILRVSGAPSGATYNWYTQSTGGTPIPGYTADSLVTAYRDENLSYWVSATNTSGCEGPRTQVTAVVINPLNPPVDIVSGLILYYKADGNLADSSGNGYNGTSSGTFSYIPDRNGNPNSAARMSNTGYIDCGNPAAIQQLTNQVTISLWVRQNQSWYGDNTPLVNKWNGNGMYMALEGASASPYSNPVRWRIDNSGVLVSNTNIPLLQWHHIVCTYNGAQLRIFQNGVLTGTLAETGTIPNTGVNLQIGRQANGGGPITFRGDVDQVRIYNRALNQSEIQTLYNNESVAFSNSPLCDGQGNLTLSTFNFAGATYNWTGPNGFSSTQQNPPIINNATTANSGTYTLRVTRYGCTSTVQTAQVVVHPLPQVIAVVNDTVCGSGNADLLVSDGGGGSTYAWYTVPVGGSPISGQTDSSYTVNNVSATVTYYVAAIRNGCQGPRTPVTAVYNSNVLTNLTVTGNTVCSNIPTVSVGVNATETGVNYQAFLGATPVSAGVWGGGNIQLQVTTSALALGNNTITIRATRPGCGGVSLANTALVTVLGLPSATITAGGPTSFCTGQSVNLTSSSGSSYAWSTGATTQQISVTNSGSYTVTVTDANGCSNSSAPVVVTVTNPPTPVITTSGPTTFCAGGNVQLTASGGGAYLWSNGSTASSITITTAGTYNVTATVSGCSSTSSDVSVTVLSLPVVSSSVAPGNTVCQGTSVTLSGTGATSYTWSGGVVNGAPFVPAGTTTYTVTGTDANGCTNTSTTTITVNNLPTVTASANPGSSICQGGSVTLNGSGASSYTWSGGVVNGTPFSPSATATYTVTGTNAIGCSATSTITVTVNALPNVSATAIPGTTVCSGTSVTLNGSGAQTYSWSGSVNNGAPFVATSTTTYTVTGTDANGCSSTASLPLTVNALPLVNAGPDQSVCAGNAVTLSGSGAVSYSWSGGVVNNVPFTPSATTTYTLTGTDANNCSNTDAVVVTVNNLPTVTASANPGSSICLGGNVTLNGNGASGYTWSGGVVNGVPFSPAGTATYTVTGTNAAGCSASSTITITVNALPNISATASPGTTVCPGTSVTLNGSGAQTYSWSGSVSNGVPFVATTTTTYTVTGTDANGCSSTTSLLLSVHPIPPVTAGADQGVCFGNPVTLSGSGALSYSWSGGVTDNIPFIPLATQAYILTGTDANNCTRNDTVWVTVFPLPQVDAGADQVSCGGSPVTLSGSGAATYNWSGGIADNVPFVPAATAAYILTGTDANNCSNTDTVLVTVGVVPMLNLGADIVQSNPPVVLDAGNGWSATQWSTGANTQTITVTANGMYICTVTNADGCTASDTIQVWFTSGIQNPGGTMFQPTLYPNPNDGRFTLRVDELHTGHLTIQITDMLGKLVYVQTAENIEYGYLNTMDMRSLRAGVYLLTLRYDHAVHTLRFVKHE